MKELVIKKPLRAFSFIYPSLMVAVYFFLTDTSILWFLILVLTLLIVACFLRFESTQLICRLDKKALFFPSVGRQIDLDKIDFIGVSGCKLMRSYVVQVHTKDAYNEIVKLRMPNRMALHKTLEFMESAGIVRVKI
ncbi:hypothetical protein [Vibrio vulnificus]|uniref:hypothetical protein n=1 Tax=Vibrio vulnificus TaxID=672 RepID=UPI000CD1A8BB|nr:hypothetical protein [Vibrio vulnificus]POC15391.1 hypothetical protein CRN42_22075 [Vibrio vulnificus]